MTDRSGAGDRGERGPLGLAIVGSGRAGAARARALESLRDARLVGIVPAHGPGADAFEALLDDPQVEALILCTPNLLHAPAARAALERGKHVAVEFPLAAGSGEARALFDLARRRERVLHVEHIELLSGAQRVQRGRVPALGPPEGGSLHFSGGLAGWIADPALAGSEALRALARLQRLLDLFGAARPEEVTLERGEGYRLEVELRFERGGSTRLVEERRPGLARALAWQVRCRHGVLDDPGAGPPSELFREDTECFLARVRSGSPSYLNEARILEGLALVEAIEAALSGP